MKNILLSSVSLRHFASMSPDGETSAPAAVDPETEADDASETTLGADIKIPVSAEDISSVYFAPPTVDASGAITSPGQLEAAKAFVEHLANPVLKDEKGNVLADSPLGLDPSAKNSEGKPLMRFNLDVADVASFFAAIPADYGVLVNPIGKRVKDEDKSKKEGKTITKNAFDFVTICAVPSLEKVLAEITSETVKDASGAETVVHSPVGENYVRQSLIDKFRGKLRNAFTNVKLSADEVVLPVTVEQFLTTSAKGAENLGLATFNKYADKMIKSIKDASGGKIILNKVLLRQILSSAQIAGSLLPDVPQDFWTMLLSSVKTVASTDKMDTKILDNWLANRAVVAPADEKATIDTAKFAFT